MSGRIVRDNIDGSITTVDDGVERTWNAEAWRLILPNEAGTVRRGDRESHRIKSRLHVLLNTLEVQLNRLNVRVLERRSVTAPGGSAPDAVAVAPVEAADIVETDVMRRWRAHGHVEIEGVAGYDVYVGGDDETPGTLRIDANAPGNQASAYLPVAQVAQLHRVLGDWLTSRGVLLPAVSGSAGLNSPVAGCGDAPAPGEYQLKQEARHESPARSAPATPNQPKERFDATPQAYVPS